jgi:hypothetical protein
LEETLAPITTEQPDTVQAKDCEVPATISESPGVTDAHDTLEPITSPGEDIVHKKVCSEPSMPSPVIQPEPVIVAPVRAAPTPSISAQRDVERSPLPPLKPYSIVLGDPSQRPRGVESDPAELYRKTRGLLRRTGRAVGAGRYHRHRKTMKKGYVA